MQRVVNRPRHAFASVGEVVVTFLQRQYHPAEYNHWRRGAAVNSYRYAHYARRQTSRDV